MNQERRITFRCNLAEAEKLFDLLYRIADAIWSTYEREFSEPFCCDSLDRYEDQIDQLGDGNQSHHHNEEIPF